jgi:hypothetical protein
MSGIVPKHNFPLIINKSFQLNSKANDLSFDSLMVMSFTNILSLNFLAPFTLKLNPLTLFPYGLSVGISDKGIASTRSARG